MIKIKRSDKPKELTDEIQNKLTRKFKQDKKEVWRKKYITDALFKMSNGKCCYCETTLGEEGKALNVEHYHHKDKYPDEVVKWDNLLPSCSRCNSNKGTHDTVLEPIIDPTVDDPKDFLYFKNYRYKSIDRNEKGLNTIHVLYLNDTNGLVKVRFNVCNALCDKLLDIEELLQEYIQGTSNSTRRKNRIVNGIKDILICAQPTKEYSSIIASTIVNDDSYKYIKQELDGLGLWGYELKELEDGAKKIMLDMK
ncbi:hypothetical protein RBU49_06965 [Clostridium sp. MB40-C1]|uniref:hypothetical protein n=1 Tax=Clostridium sp. MB40-C1 TaxID=3070996 RepID=UPI0027E148A0|nr:hypothetical protein [Clostridium sp. MB40-C1]WMJ81983.1 hypothetical protein RBU49_06965 [Clostridium sp. MB40-C1]